MFVFFGSSIQKQEKQKEEKQQKGDWRVPNSRCVIGTCLGTIHARKGRAVRWQDPKERHF